MIFWALAAIMTAVVTIALLAPLARRGPGADADASSHDVEVYRDQLAEVERDVAEGLIEPGAAEYARAEIARRLLRAARNEAAARQDRPWSPAGVARIAVILGVPGIAMGAYLATGAPDLPHQPLASRQVEPQAPATGGPPPEVAALIAQAEQHLATNPQDGRGWDVLAPIYMRVGRLEDARNAYVNAIRLLGPSGARQGGYGETLVALAGGVVTEEARVAFQSARELEPDDPRSAFFLALALAQEGRTDRAVSAFEAIAEASDPAAPWMPAVDAQLAALGAEPAPVADLSDALPEPSEDQIAAASDMAPADRQAMIEGMVRSLDARLRAEPNDIDGWIRLVRSYGVLGRTDEASAALARGLQTFPQSSDDGAALVRAAREAGVVPPVEETEQ